MAERGDWCVTRGEKVRERWCVLEKQKSQLFYQQDESSFIWEDQRNLQFGSSKLWQTVANCSVSEETKGRLAFSRYQEEIGEVVAALHWLQAVGRLWPGQEGIFLPAAVCDPW